MLIQTKPLTNPNPPSFHTIKTRAMHTNVEIQVWTTSEERPALESFAAAWLKSVENRFSRFLPESELNHLNRLAGEHCLVSDAMLEVLQLADRYQRMTGGIFNPLMLEELQAEGYNATFDEVQARAGHRLDPSPRNMDRESAISIAPIMKSVRIPAERRLDLGGIVKSWAVRRLAEHFRRAKGVPQGLVNAGGDLYVWSSKEAASEPWAVGIEDPWQPERDIGMLRMAEGAAATSSALGRVWSTDQGERHHLIDPRTGHSSRSGIVQCTVMGPDVTECEVWAKTLCVLGAEEGIDLMQRHTYGYEAVLFTEDRKLIYCGAKKSLNGKWTLPPADFFYN